MEQARARLEAGELRAEALTAQAQTAAEAADAAQRHWYELSATAERYRSLAAVVTERAAARRHPTPPPTGPDPRAARAQAERTAQEAETADADLTRARDDLERAVAARQAAEDLSLIHI